MAISPISSVAQNLSSTVGKISKNKAFSKVCNTLTPTGANNSFIALAAIMFLAVVLPRVKTAATRNPDDKEATQDEIKEILFRDVQTVLIILFALKSINSVVGHFASKSSGLPMTNKPYEKLFDTTKKGFEGIKEKAGEFVHEPLKKLKTTGKNILDTLHPTGGVRMKTNDEILKEYSNFTSIQQVHKMYQNIEANGGNSTKIFNENIDDIISGLERQIQKYDSQRIDTAPLDRTKVAETGFERKIKRTKANIEYLKQLKEQGPDSLKNLDEVQDKTPIEIILKFLNNPRNSLVMGAKRVNGLLRLGALTFEALYLGLGLPALNQKRLEKKYLNNPDTFTGSIDDKSQTSLLDKNIKAREVKLYHSFLAKKQN